MIGMGPLTYFYTETEARSFMNSNKKLLGRTVYVNEAKDKKAKILAMGCEKQVGIQKSGLFVITCLLDSKDELPLFMLLNINGEELAGALKI